MSSFKLFINAYPPSPQMGDISEFAVLTRQTTKNRVVKPYHFEQSYQKCLVALTQDGMNEKGRRRGINHDKLPTLELGN